MRLTICAKLAWRDLVGAPRSSLTLVVVIALSVAANTVIRATSDDFTRVLGDIERAGIAGNLCVDLHESPEPNQFEALRRAGVKWTLITSTMFPVRSEQAADPSLPVIKAVDPRAYPFYGELRLTPALPLSSALAGTSAVVSPQLLRELALKVGDALAINGVECRITAVIDQEPDRFAGTFAIPFRAIVSEDTLEKTNVLRYGPPALFRFAVAIPRGRDLAQTRKHLAQTFPQGTVLDADSASPGVDAAGTVSGFLGVLAWLALALGAAGVIVATYLHVRSRLETLATLKCLGARNWPAFWWLAIELLLLGACGGILGCGVGFLARQPVLWMAGIGGALSEQRVAPLVLEAVLIGIALPEVLGLAWVLPAIRQRPAMLLRRETEYSPDVVAFSIANVFGWLAISAASGYLVVGSWHATGMLILLIAAALLVILSLFQLGFRLAQRAASNRPLANLPLTFRHGARNFLSTESNNRVVTIIAAFVVMLSILTGFGQTMVVREVARSLPMSRDNVYLMGFPHSDLAGIRLILERHREIEKPYDIRTFAWFRVSTNASTHESPDSALLLPQFMVACSTDFPAGSAVLDKSMAQRLGARAGSRITLFDTDGQKLDATIQAIRDVAPAKGAWSSITIPCARVDAREMFHYAGLKLPDEDIPALARELRVSFPALAVSSPQEIFAQVTNVVGTGAALVKFVSLLTIAIGVAVVAALIAASARQRSHQIAILRALGARRRIVWRILTCEFAILGSAAGLLGGIGGLLLMDFAQELFSQKLSADLQWAALSLAILAGVVLSLVAGLLSCAHVLRSRPLITLRRD